MKGIYEMQKLKMKYCEEFSHLDEIEYEEKYALISHAIQLSGDVEGKWYSSKLSEIGIKSLSTKVCKFFISPCF